MNVTVPAVGPDEAAAAVRASGGCRTAKVKVAEPGQTLAEDLARVEAVRDALGPDGQLRIDANGAWSVETAIDAIRALDRAAGGLEYVEQPCATVEGLADVAPPGRRPDRRRRVDPSGRGPARGSWPWTQPTSPSSRSSRSAGCGPACDIAEQIGLPVVVSSALETSVGIAMGVALAAALPELPYACGLATVQLLGADVVAEPLLPVDGAARGARRCDPDLARPRPLRRRRGTRSAGRGRIDAP